MAHTSYEDLEKKINLAKQKVEVGGKYHHWKDPDTHYTVLAVGFTEWNEEVVVVYQNLKNGMTWVRRYEGQDGWLTPVDSDGPDKSRFIKVK